jgi:hypothetical protein
MYKSCNAGSKIISQSQLTPNTCKIPECLRGEEWKEEKGREKEGKKGKEISLCTTKR